MVGTVGTKAQEWECAKYVKKQLLRRVRLARNEQEGAEVGVRRATRRMGQARPVH